MRWWVAGDGDDDDDELWRNKRKGRWGRLVGGDTAGLIMDQVHATLAPSISFKTFKPFSYSFCIWSTLAQCVEKSSIFASHHAAGQSTAHSLIIVAAGNFLAVSGASADNVLSEYPTCLHHDLSLILLRRTKCVSRLKSVVWKVAVGCMQIILGLWLWPNPGNLILHTTTFRA